MFDNIDSFVALSRENTCVKEVELYPFDREPGNYELWDKVGQIVGNLRKLSGILFHFLPYSESDDDRDEAHMPDWEIMTRILRCLRHKISLRTATEDNDAGVEDIQGLARAIHGHPMIIAFDCRSEFSYANFGPWCSALATLLYIERIELRLREPETEDQRALVNVEPLKELLRAPALRVVIFGNFYFTNELCHATANALAEGSSITKLIFCECSFPDESGAIIANALKTNATVTDVHFYDDCDELFCNTLAAVLLCNSTLQNLALWPPNKNPSGRWLSSIFLTLGMNTTLTSLNVNICGELGDELSAAITNGLAKNSTLEVLSLEDMTPSEDDGALSARNALAFLRTNSTLKSLTVSFERTQNASAFRLEAVKMLENTFLESLTIERNGSGIKVKELLEMLSALQLNTTLNTLGFQTYGICYTVDEVIQLVSVLMKNYGLERLVPDIPCADDRTVKAILRLNAAGRWYLIEDGSSISKGVNVLSAVSDDINCVFLHLNPSLCDRRAADITTDELRPSANLDDSSSTGKRERTQSQPGKEHRRRLAYPNK